MMLLIPLAFSLSLMPNNIESYQSSADFVTEVSVLIVHTDNEEMIKATPVRQIRGVNSKSFRLWIIGKSNLVSGRYVVFYNLCDRIGYSTMGDLSVLPVKDGRVSFNTNKSGWVTLAPKKIQRWMINNGLSQNEFDFQCLPGRSGHEGN